ncbi:hypothetical protein DS62_03765 [Smithella sp. SC_K08D17]|nr:hypothetical protein DS62_03765 [Smithella sp. SC_K08D17]
MRTGHDFSAVRERKFSKPDSVFLRSPHGRGNYVNTRFLGCGKILVTAVKGIGQDFPRGKTAIFRGFDGGNQRMSITFSGGFQCNMCNLNLKEFRPLQIDQ